MKKVFRFSFFLVMVLILFGFAMEKISPDEFYKFFKENKNEYLKKSTINEFEYQVLYRPYQFDLIDFVKNENPTPKELKKYLKENENNLDFILKLGIPKQGSKEFLKYEKGDKSFDEKIIYYSFEFKKDIVLVVDSQDTLRPQFYNFERSYDIMPSGEFLISFHLKNKKFSTVKLLIEDNGFEKNNLEFSFTKNNLFNFPELKNYKKWS